MARKPLTSTVKRLYGIGDMGFTIMTSVETVLWVFFLTNVAKFSLPMVALIGTITSLVDAALSPFYGAIISGSKGFKWGKNRSWLIISPPFVVVLFMFQFTRIGPEPIAAAIICAGFILSHIIWNLAWVANVSLISIMGSTPDERALLSSRRGAWNALSGVFFSYIGMPLALYLGSTLSNPILGFTLEAGLMALVMQVTYFIHFKISDGYEPTGDEMQNTASDAPKAEKVPVSIMLKSAFQNPPLIALLLSDFCRYMVNFIMLAAAAYYFTYVAQNMALLPVYLLIGAIAQVVGAYMAGMIAKALSTRTASIVGLFAMAASLIICKFVAYNIILFFIFVCLARFFLGLLYSTLVALYSDVVTYGEWRTGQNANSFIMGLMNISLKVAIISRSAVIPFVLAAAGFVAGADPATASMQLKDAVNNVFLLIPGLVALVGGLILTVGYRLTREKLEYYQKEIDARKVSI
ncbi:MFS transporter [Desulfitobacterium sp.]|uniref:MFS transporter n=1 Tax=Desulfitobacterium sp. TaxID=49981 RepID=UPI002B216FD8|nr:MFS transporter [Desulfitobacterium sp.]MEA4901961.1 MFS transporter [Desulfitobacterium sp.]